ncbi:MAG: PHP domain-containing protein [Gemmatimonadales bacterium]
MSRLWGFLVGLLLLYVVWRLALMLRHRLAKDVRSPAGHSILRELRSSAIGLALFAGFVAVGALWHRPMLSLAGTGPDDVVVDFHSHTNVSHDVRGTWMRGFDAEANRRWHARAGFDAGFITDHNVGSRESGVGSRELRVTSQESRVASRSRGVTPDSRLPTPDSRLPTLCPGIEVSAWRAHIILLGDTLPVDRRRYNGSLDELLLLLAISDSAYGSLSVASLPEYRRNHWERLDLLIRAGLDGFEIVNASPKANELSRADRDSVVALARRHNRFVVGVSDSHGWGATSMVWNLVRVPSGSAHICASVLRQLQTGFPAVRVIERHRLRPDAWWPVWLTPAGVVWETWRSMGMGLAGSWLVWIWAAGWALGRNRRIRGNPAPRPRLACGCLVEGSR